MSTIDVHQHLWPEALLGALAHRHRPPMMFRHGDGWTLRIHGEGEVLAEEHTPDGTRVRARVGAELATAVLPYLVAAANGADPTAHGNGPAPSDGSAH